jgi:hypothetical protein
MIAAPAAVAEDRRARAARRDSRPLTRSLQGLRLTGRLAGAAFTEVSKCHCARASDGPDSETRRCPGHFKYRDLSPQAAT